MFSGYVFKIREQLSNKAFSINSVYLCDVFLNRIPSYEHLMAFWKLIETATSKMIRVTKINRSYATSTTTESPLTRPTVSIGLPKSRGGRVN